MFNHPFQKRRKDWTPLELCCFRGVWNRWSNIKCDFLICLLKYSHERILWILLLVLHKTFHTVRTNDMHWLGLWQVDQRVVGASLPPQEEKRRTLASKSAKLCLDISRCFLVLNGQTVIPSVSHNPLPSGPEAQLVDQRWSAPGGGVLPYIGYTGMCRWKGYGFQAIWSV